MGRNYRAIFLASGRERSGAMGTQAISTSSGGWSLKRESGLWRGKHSIWVSVFQGGTTKLPVFVFPLSSNTKTVPSTKDTRMWADHWVDLPTVKITLGSSVPEQLILMKIAFEGCLRTRFPAGEHIFGKAVTLGTWHPLT